MTIFLLADRLHKTPAEIREGFDLNDYRHFLAYLRIRTREQQTP